MKKIFKELSRSHDSSIIVKEEIAVQFASPFHFHKGFEFTYIVKGHGKFYGGSRLLNFKEGELYFFGVGFPHLFVNDKAFLASKEKAHSIIIQFDEDFFTQNFLLIPEFNQVKKLLKMAYWGVKIARPSAELRKLLTGIVRKKGLQAVIALLQLFEILSSLPKSAMTNISSEALNSFDEKLEPVYQYILGNFKHEISTGKAAEMAFMNASAFCRYFKRRTGKTLSQFTNHVRITHAVHLLMETGMDISGICYECGFDNLSYFNRQFKAQTGESPTAYRKGHKASM